MIVRQARMDPTATRFIRPAYVAAPLCPQTISRRLAEANLRSQRSLLVLPLTPEHQRRRLQWYQPRATWNATDWQCVVMSVASFWEQMITVSGCGGSQVNDTIPISLSSVTLPPLQAFWSGEPQPTIDEPV